MPTPPRSPVPDGLAGYPTLSEFAASRRRFLKLCALSSAALTLGIPLSGCPDPSGGGGGGGEWVPWEEEHLAGAMPMPMGQPVGVVVGGGPVPVTFSDGAQVDLVVAGVFTPYDGLNADPAADFSSGAAQHAELVKAEAAKHAGSALQDPAAQDALENAIRDAINATLSNGYLDEASVAEARKEVSQAPAGASRSAPAAAAPMPADEAAALAAPAEAAGDVAPAAPPARDKSFRRIWIPCRKPGCTHCS